MITVFTYPNCYKICKNCKLVKYTQLPTSRVISSWRFLSLKYLISLNCYVSATILKYMLTTVIVRCVALIDRINTQDNFYGTQSKFMANKWKGCLIETSVDVLLFFISTVYIQYSAIIDKTVSILRHTLHQT